MHFPSSLQTGISRSYYCEECRYKIRDGNSLTYATRRIEITPNSSLLIVIVTEGAITETGGLIWWEKEGNPSYHEKFRDFYRDALCFNHGSKVHELIVKLKRRTVVQVACGVALKPIGIQSLHKWMSRFDIPQTSNNMLCAYILFI